jgi:hypothetical protein
MVLYHNFDAQMKIYQYFKTKRLIYKDITEFTFHANKGK